jgi:hypothetical protein
VNASAGFAGSIRLLIIQGGLFSNPKPSTTAFITLPVWSDQPINAQKAHDDGYAMRLVWDHLTEEILFGAIQGLVLVNELLVYY